MSATTEADVSTELPAGLVEQVLRLSDRAQLRLLELIDEARREATRAEIARRLAAVDSGEMPTYSREETREYLRRVAAGEEPE